LCAPTFLGRGQWRRCRNDKSRTQEEVSEKVSGEIPRATQEQRQTRPPALVEARDANQRRDEPERRSFQVARSKKIAASLKRSAEHSHRRKANPYRSALSMLTFYINRAGKNLPASRKKVLNQAKDELKEQFHRA